MKVKELKQKLDKLIAEGKGELEILTSIDDEGNGFNALDEISLSYCYDDEPVHPDDVGTEYDENDLVEKIIFW